MIDSFRVLSLFPDLFTYELLAVTLLRVFLGLTFVYYGVLKLFSRRASYRARFLKLCPRVGAHLHSTIGIIEIIAGLMLFVGLYTQAAAIVFAALNFIAADLKLRHPKILPNPSLLYVSLAIISLSLLFLGPGIFAIDLPL